MRQPSAYTTDTTEQAEVHAWSGPALLDFGTNWCGHCQAAGPLVAQALEFDEVVRTAVAENSLSPQSIEAAIRKGLLPLLFGKLGLDRAKEAVEQIVQITRLGVGKAQ